MSNPNELQQLKPPRRLGVFGLVFFVLGAAAPLTIVSGFLPIGLIAGGDSIVMGFIIPGIVYLIFAAGFAAMSRHFQGEGAFYAYISKAMGPRVGGAAGLVSYIGYLAGQIGFTSAAGVFASSTMKNLTGVDLNWIVYAMLFTIVVGLLGYRSVHIGARVLAVLLIGELGVLTVFCIAVLVHGGHAGLGLHTFAPEVIFSAALPGVFVMTFTAFVGFEQTAIYAKEVKDTRRTVSRATYTAVIVLAVFYSFCAWTVLQAIGPDRMTKMLAGDPAALIFALNDEYAGTAMTVVMQILIVTSFFAGVLALQNACARYLHALALKRILPRPLGRVGRETGSPSVANVVQAILTIAVIGIFALAGADPYLQTVVWTNTATIVSVLAMQVVASIAVVIFFSGDRHGESVWARVVFPITAAILVASALTLLVSQMSLLTRLGPAGNFLIILPLIIAAIIGYLRAAWVVRHPEPWSGVGPSDSSQERTTAGAA